MGETWEFPCEMRFAVVQRAVDGGMEGGKGGERSCECMLGEEEEGDDLVE